MRAIPIYQFPFVTLPTYGKLSLSILTALFLIVKTPNEVLQNKGEKEKCKLEKIKPKLH
jgi:hypothetical protein